MKVRTVTLAMALAAASLTTGCAVFDSMRSKTDETTSRFGPSDEAPSDEWDFVGEVGRGDRPREKDPDSWWQYLMHPTAVSIERNLGIDY